MIDEGDLRVGDVLLVACPFTSTRVERGLTRDHVSVRWPWWDIDTDNESAHWNGIVTLGLAGGGRAGPRRRPGRSARILRPNSWKRGTSAGSECPPAVVHVTAVEHHDPPLETAWLPHPTRTVTVLLTRTGTPCSAEDAAAVAAGTASGSHQQTIRDWMSVTKASPSP